MARTPTAPDLNRRILRMEEEIRQLRLRQPSGMPITTFTGITDADLYNRSGPFEGWQVNDPIVFSKQGNTVHVWGSVLWTGASAGYPYTRVSILRAGVIPADFMPNSSRRILTTSGGIAVPEQLWSMALLDDGTILAFSPHEGTPGAPWGRLSDFATPTISLEFTYPVAI